MELIVFQGFRCSYLLNRKPTTCSINFLSLLHKYPEGSACRQNQFLDTHKNKIVCLNNFGISNNENGRRFKLNNLKYEFTIQYCTSSKSDDLSKVQPSKDCIENEKNITAFQKMKQLAKNYWNVLLPVHIVTSICWGSAFYICIKHGVDIVGILKSMHLSEKYLDMLQKSNAGDWAFTYALYKICTPFRYTVTIGLTTGLVKYLKNIGCFKSVKKTQLAR